MIYVDAVLGVLFMLMALVTFAVLVTGWWKG